MRPAWVALLLIAVPAQAQQTWMVGSWFGTGQYGNPSGMYIDRMKSDGAWRGEYRTCIAGKPRDGVQSGRWELQGDMLILNVETVGGQARPRTDYYRMLSHEANGQKYLNLRNNFVFTPRRVADTFAMPSCELVS